MLFLAIVTSIIGYIGWYWALAKGGISRIATIQFFQPISGLILAAILLGEQLTLPLAGSLGRDPRRRLDLAQRR